MKNLFPLLVALCLGGCASHAPVPHFIAPSTAPVHTAIHATAGHIADAQDHAKRALAALDLATARPEIDALSKDLLAAQSEAANAETELQKSDAKVVELTASANAVVDNNNRLIGENASLHNSVRMWRKVSIFAILALVGALAWIFRKPLFALLAGGI